MRETEYAFAVAKIRANENNLLTEADLEGLITADGVEAAQNQLSQLGFADFSDASEDAVLRRREQEAFDLICEIAPDKNLFDFLVVKNDFHNAKAILKSMVTGNDVRSFLLYPCLTQPELFRRAVEEKNPSLLAPVLSDAVFKGYELITATMDAQALDVLLDRLSLEASISLAEQSKEAFSVGLAERIAAAADFRIACRAARMGKDAAFIGSALAGCSLLDTERLTLAALGGDKPLAEYIAQCGFDTLADALSVSDIAFERAADDLLIDYVKNARYQSFGIAPLIGYYIARVSEIKTVRIILSCKRCQMPPERIRERVRKLYV